MQYQYTQNGSGWYYQLICKKKTIQEHIWPDIYASAVLHAGQFYLRKQPCHSWNRQSARYHLHHHNMFYRQMIGNCKSCRQPVHMRGVSCLFVYFLGGRLSKLGTPSGIWWKGWISQVKIAAWALNMAGLSKVPTLTIMESGRDGLSVPMAVPQWLQKCRVTGVSRSLLAKVLGVPEW